MWNFKEIHEQLARAYYEAALTDVNMRVAADSFETLRSEISRADSLYKAWEIFDEQIGVASDDRLQGVLSALRDRFEQSVRQSETERLLEVFRPDARNGYHEWLLAFCGALTNWRITLCLHLCSEQFPFPETADRPLAWFQRYTRLVLHERWPDAYDLFSYLSGKDSVPSLLRAKLFVIMGEIQLYHLAAPKIAKELFERAANFAPDELRTICGMGEYWLVQKEFDKAESEFRRASEVSPRRADGYIGLGDLHKEMDDIGAAEQSYQEAIRVDGGNSQGYIRLVRLYGSPISFGKYRDRLPYLTNRAVAISPSEEYSIFLETGAVFQDNQDFQTAHEWYRKAIELDSRRLGGYIADGYACLAEGKLDEACAAFQKGIEVAPESLEGYLGLAGAFERQGLWEESLHSYQECLIRRPQWEVFIRGRIGSAKWQLKSYSEAEDEGLRALRLDPAEKAVLRILLRMVDDYYKELSDPSAALHLLDRIREIIGVSFDADYQNNIGNMKYYLGEYQEAMVRYRSAVASSPTTPVYSSNLLHALRRMKEYDEGGILWNEAPPNVREDQGCKEGMSLLRNDEANEHFEQKDYGGAIQLYQEAIDFSPADPVLYSNLALALEFDRSGGDGVARIGRSILALQSALQHDSGNEEYKRRLRRLEEISDLIPAFGERALNLLPAVTPIALEVAGDLIPLTEERDTGRLSPEIAQLIGEMRRRILFEYGVKIPGVRVRGNETDLPNGTYIVMINEIPLVSGFVDLSRGLCNGTVDGLALLGVKGEEAINPVDGSECTWVDQTDWPKLKDAGREIWTPLQYIVSHLYAIVQKNLTEFLSLQALADLLEEKAKEEYSKILSAKGGFPRFASVARALLAEKVPIKELKEICNCYLDSLSLSTHEIPEEIRCLQTISMDISGNTPDTPIYRLGQTFISIISDGIQHDGEAAVLALEPETTQEVLTAVRNEVSNLPHGSKTPVLFTDDWQMRPFVRKLVELEFPNLAVLSRREALDLDSRPVLATIDVE